MYILIVEFTSLVNGIGKIECISHFSPHTTSVTVLDYEKSVVRYSKENREKKMAGFIKVILDGLNER